MRRAVRLLPILIVSCLLRSVGAQGAGPDIIVSDITGVANFLAIGGIDAYSFGTAACNRGSANVAFTAGTAQHPVLIENLCRLENGRLEQIGMSWAKHESSALAQSGLCGTCVNPGSIALLGVGCTTSSSASSNGGQSVLGPRSAIDAATGAFPFPLTPGGSLTSIDRRLQVAVADIDPALHPGALYFVEVQYVAADDAAAGKAKNNASFRQVSFSGVAPNFTALLGGSTTTERSALHAWRNADPNVVIQTIDIAGDGRFEVAFRVSSSGGGTTHVDVVVRNHDSSLGAGALTINFPAAASISNIAFHDVHHHSGEPFSGTDWTTSLTPTSLRFETSSFATDPNANAIRFGTAYTFSFDTNVAPTHGVIDTFAPGGPTAVGFGFCTNTGATAAAAPFAQDFDALLAPSTLAPCAGGSLLGPAWEIEASDPAARVRILDSADAALPLGIAQPSGMNGTKTLVLDRDSSGPNATNTLALHIDGTTANAFGLGFMIRMLVRDLDDEADLEDVFALTDGVTSGAAVLSNGSPSPMPGHGGFKEVLLEDWNAAQLGNGWREFQYVVDGEFLASRGLVLSNDMRLVIRHAGNGSAPSDGLAIDAVRIDAVLSRTFPSIENFDTLQWNGAGPGTTTPPDGWVQSSTDLPGSGGDWVFRNAPDPLDPFGPSTDASTAAIGGGYWSCAGPLALGPTISMTSAAVDVNPFATNQYVTVQVFNNSPTSTTQAELHVDLIGVPVSGPSTTFLDVIPPIGHQGPSWQKFASANVSAMINPFPKVRVRLRATSVVSTSTQKVCIDDVTFTQLGFGAGKQPDPNGSLEIGDDTVEVNGFTIDSGFPGPYMATEIAGNPFPIRLRGQPFQPSILLISPAIGPPIVMFGQELQVDLAFPISVVGDAFAGMGLLGSNMFTDATGGIVLNVPAAVTAPLSGLSIALQGVIGAAGTPIGLASTNAVVLTFM